MHDWSLIGITIDWKSGESRLELESHLGRRIVVAKGVSDLKVPRAFPWGPSISVNTVTGPIERRDGSKALTIEMQSGDTIELVATEFDLPSVF